MKINLRKRLIGKRVNREDRNSLLQKRSDQTRLPGGVKRTGGVGLGKLIPEPLVVGNMWNGLLRISL